MSNRAALITILTDLDGIEDRLRAVAASTSSVQSTSQIYAARDCMIRAKLRLAASLTTIDPVIDLPSTRTQMHTDRAGAVS